MCLYGADADVPLVTDIRQLCCFISGCCNVLDRKRINVCDSLPVPGSVSVCVYVLIQF